jgi:uncharacterized membrane protein
MHAGVMSFRVTEHIHQAVHAIEFEETMLVIHMPFHAEIDPAVDPIQRFLIALVL